MLHLIRFDRKYDVNRTYDTLYTRCSCQSDLANRCANCACQPCEPAGWLALLLIKTGDVETTLGPRTTRKQVWICDICHIQIYDRKQISIRCNRIEQWVHLRLAMHMYPPGTIYRYLDLPSTQTIQTHNTHS